MHSRSARAAWLGVYVLALAVPLSAAWLVGREASDDVLTQLSMASGVAALALLAVALVLPARVHALVASFGIEKILRGHKTMAIAAVVLVGVHVVLVLVTDPRGLDILDLTDTTAAATAATVSTVALLVVVTLALRRRRRKPRYEGWRMMHVFLAGTIFAAAALHVWWLDNLVADPVFRLWFLVLVAAVLLLAVRRWVWLPLRAHRRSYVVEDVRQVAGNAVTVVVRAHGHAGLPFRAGQFAWLKIGSSSFVFEEHPFSIASTAERPHLKEFTIKALGDFSELLTGLKPGRRVFLDGPYGRFTMEGLNSDGFVLIAGGVGITPMLSMLRTLSDRRDHRHHQLIVGARTAEDILLRHELVELKKHLDLEVTEIIEAPEEDWSGETGRISGELLERRLPRHRKHHDYFLCGPAPMVVSVGRELREQGIPVRRIHTEQFETV